MTIRQKLAQWFYSPGAYGLWVALDDWENWSVSTHVASYRAPPRDPSKFNDKYPVAVMWIANGASHFDGRPEDGTPKFLGWYERRWLWKKFKKKRDTSTNRKMLYRFTRLEQPE